MASAELIRRYYDAFNRADWDAMLACLTDDVAHDLNQGTRETGREAFRTLFATAASPASAITTTSTTGSPR